jgi:hypothetical protein
MPANAQMNGNGISPVQANQMARNMLVSGAVKRTQQIFSQTVDLSQRNVLDIQPRNAGLVLGFIVNIVAPYSVALGGTPLTRTPFGPTNLLKRVSFFDLNNNTRIQTAGWHLHAVNSARAEKPYGSVDTFTDLPVAYGKKFRTILDAPATIAAEASGTAAATYFVPLAYSDQDLRGAIYMNVVNATANLQLTLNDGAVQARSLSGWSDAVFCTADGSTPPAGVTEGNVTVEVYQVYYDQLPRGEQGVILPLLDLSTIYEIKNTTMQGVVQNQDFPIPYSNFRDFLSTFAVYRNRVNATGSPDSVGFQNVDDIAKWKLESANFTNVFDVGEKYAGLWGRNTFQADPALGVYYFPTRNKPITTQTFGNMNLILNANNVQTNAAVLIGYEAFGLSNVIMQASGLAPA